jgi:hypothetical protein
MTSRARVGVLCTKPETVLRDFQRLFDLAGGANALDPGVTTIVKYNISWHYPMPRANTTPWQLEGTIRALQRANTSWGNLFERYQQDGCLASTGEVR